MATQKGGGLISRAVREALSTLVSPQLCEQLIARSLARQGLEDIPESGSEIGEWLENGLRGEVETAVGPDAADLLMTQLGPMAAYAAISKPRAAPVAPQPAPSAPRRISSLPPRPFASDAPGSRAQPGRPAADAYLDDDEPDRPTALRFDTAQEPDWAPEQPAKGPRAAASDDAWEHQRPTAERLDASDDAWGDQRGTAPRMEAFHSGPPTGLFGNREAFAAPANANAWSDAESNVRSVSAEPPRAAMFMTTRPQDEEVASDAPAVKPVVLTATADQHDLAALERYLSASAQVVHIPDLVGLLDMLEDKAMVEPIVLVDCQRPTLHITSVSALGEDLPKGTTVVLWGVDDHTWSQIDRERSPTCRWVRCSREATTDDVGSLCSMLIG